MDMNQNLQKNIDKKDGNQIKEKQNGIDINKKENKIKDFNINIGLIEKGNKENNQKNIESLKIKIGNKINEKEIGNKRVNNFINSSTSNINVQHNRYYSTNTSKNYFRNFVKKSNYNKNKDNPEEKGEENDFDIDNHFNENRPFSFTSRNNFLKNNYMNKGLDYILGCTNPNNNKGFFDNKKSEYNYKNFVRGKRNNYVNKKIFFNQNKIKNLQNINEISQNYFNQNNEDEKQNIINNERENFTRQSYILMNDIINTDNLNINIMNIAGNILNNIGYKDQMVGNNLLLQYLFN
jgi:hypothetical protein